MYKLITLATLLVGLALAPVLRGSVGDDNDEPLQTEWSNDDERVNEQLHGGANRSLVSTSELGTASCEWRCEPCEAGRGCTQVCAEIGNCGSTCNVVARCDVEYVWDEASCRCVN